MALKHLELFSGIGGFRKAFELIEKDFNLKIKTVGFSEIDTYASKVYKANFDTTHEIEMGDIVSFVNDISKLKKLSNFDVLSGGFPCQSFSLMGKKKGFNDVRGNVFFQIIKVIKEKKPKYILLENVRNLRTHDKGNTFQTILAFLKDAGYPYIYHDIFNSADFGLAQRRNRVFIFATNIQPPKNFIFNSEKIKKSFLELGDSHSLLKHSSVLDVLEKEVDKKFFISSILKPTILSNGTKNFKSKSEINPLIARPLTATMVKMHRACQDNYYSQEFILNPQDYMKKNYTKEDLLNQSIRKITPKEAFLFQGFEETFFKNAQNSGVSNHQLYKQAGNQRNPEVRSRHLLLQRQPFR